MAANRGSTAKWRKLKGQLQRASKKLESAQKDQQKAIEQAIRLLNKSKNEEATRQLHKASKSLVRATVAVEDILDDIATTPPGTYPNITQ